MMARRDTMARAAWRIRVKLSGRSVCTLIPKDEAEALKKYEWRFDNLEHDSVELWHRHAGEARFRLVKARDAMKE